MEEADEGIPLEYERGEQTVRLLPPADCRAPVSSLVAAVRLYHDDPTAGGGACAALLWPKLGRRAGGGAQSPRQLGSRAFDALIGDGWTVPEAIGLCELAALHCVLHVGRMNVREAEDF